VFFFKGGSRPVKRRRHQNFECTSRCFGCEQLPSHVRVAYGETRGRKGNLNFGPKSLSNIDVKVYMSFLFPSLVPEFFFPGGGKIYRNEGKNCFV
jgi:hypothetical protein